MSDTIEKLNHLRIVEQANRLKEKFDVNPLKKSDKEIIEDNAKARKWADRYVVIKRNLEACREAKPTATESVETGPAKHWEIMRDQIAAKVSTTKQRLIDVTNQLQLQINTHESKLKSVEAKLKAALERSKQQRKTKDEIRLEKELTQLATQFKAANPDKDLEFYMPGYKSLLLGIPLPPTPTVVKEKPAEPEKEELEQEQEEEQEDELAKLTAWSKMTPWQRWVLSNPQLHADPYKMYHSAVANGIVPDIPEPAAKEKTTVKKSDTHANKTVSRESLSKVIPGYN